jgi:succinate dehydrogenase/fumarate reductase flavoprotein subunit
VFDAPRRAARPFVGDTVWTLSPGDPGHAPVLDDSRLPAWLVRAETIEALAEQIGIPAARLRATVSRFNEQAAANLDDDFGRGSFAYDRFSQTGPQLRPVSEPPFYALRVVPGALGTKGGVKTDADGRAMRAVGGEVVPGLFAAGNAAASPFGRAYPGPGATIGPAMVFGWSAGHAAAA